MKKIGSRLELRARLDVDGEFMSLELWRVPSNKMMVEIKEENKKLLAFADTPEKLQDFIERAYKLMKKART